jgi:glycosyltransferase involved in cell wall biosynthesis
MPNKVGEYLASGVPVITCRVGDLTDFLKNGLNAYVAEPGDERSFAEQMLLVMRDPVAADRIGSAGQRACATHLDYRVHASDLARFFGACMACYRQGASSQATTGMERLDRSTETIC